MKGQHTRVLRVQFTVRWLMVAVAAGAILCCVIERRARFQRLAAEHESRTWFIAMVSVGAMLFDRMGRPVEVWESDWHKVMAQKYRRAARFPFLPVMPDPPMEQYRRGASNNWPTSWRKQIEEEGTTGATAHTPLYLR
jgi:hypothetical protein